MQLQLGSDTPNKSDLQVNKELQQENIKGPVTNETYLQRCLSTSI